MVFTYTFPTGMEKLSEVLMAIMFIRNYNKQKDTKFQKCPSDDPSKIVYNIRHNVPPLLKALIHMDLVEEIDVAHMEDTENPYIYTYITSKEKNALTIDTKTHYRINDGKLVCETNVLVDYKGVPIPKILHTPVMEWTRNRTDAVRKCELQTVCELFSKPMPDWTHVSVESSSSFQ